MTAVLLSVHVLAAIVFVGPVTVAASVFPRYARLALAEPPGNATALGTALGALHRLTRVYALAAIAVPVLGIGTAVGLHVLGDRWVSASMGLTLVAGLLLALRIVPDQRRVLVALEGHHPDPEPPVVPLPRLAMVTGLFNLAWATVVVLMILRPGSTNGLHR